MEARAAALERARGTLDSRGIERGGLEERGGRGGLEGGGGGRSSSGLERRVNSHLNHASTASSQVGVSIRYFIDIDIFQMSL